jgi:hypothetical protein
MATPIEVYDSIVEVIQKQIDILGNLSIQMSDEEIGHRVRRIGLLNQQLEEQGKRLSEYQLKRGSEF